MQYFVVMIDYGRRGREAVVDPEITRREVISRVASGEYKNISFIHEIADASVEDVTADILSEAARPRPPSFVRQPVKAVALHPTRRFRRREPALLELCRRAGVASSSIELLTLGTCGGA